MTTAENACIFGQANRFDKNCGMVEASNAWVILRVGPASTSQANRQPKMAFPRPTHILDKPNCRPKSLA